MGKTINGLNNEEIVRTKEEVEEITKRFVQ
jgi:hypothetical protein